jgi:hypothetical protein
MKIKTIFVSLISSLLFSHSVFSMADELVSTSVQSAQSAVQEVVGLRNDHTRIWEYTRQVPIIDDETGITELVTVRSQVYEKADNLCYNRSETATPEWVPTVEEITPVSETGFAYASNQGVYKVSFTGDLTAPWSIVYSLEKQQLRLGVRYLGYYDTSNGSSVFISSVASVVPKLVSPNKLYYSNAFPGVDIEYVYTKGRFLQNAIINSLSSYPSPAKYGMNPQTTQLIIATELDLADNPALALSINNQKYTGIKLDAEGKEPIVISNATTGKQLCSFEPNIAFDNSTIEQRQEITVTQQLLSLNDKHYLVEGVPLTWITSATLPVTIDYELKSGGINGNETWQSGKTYYVSSPVTINNGSIVVIQGNTIIKLRPDTGSKLTVASGGKIVARGYKFNYVIFTSSLDNTVGEQIISPPWAPYYPCAIQLNSGSSPSSMIRYCKIKFASYGIIIGTNLATDNQVQNNVIRGGETSGEGIKITSTGNAVLKNNLIVNRDIGIEVLGTAIIWLNTIDSTRIGIQEVNGYASVTDTLISNAYQYSLASSNGIFNHDYNAFYNAPLGSGISTASHETTLQANPYIVSPNGSYYLNQARTEEPGNPICPCVDGGLGSAIDADMQWKTTSCPTTFFSGNNNNPYSWQKVARDTDQVDIGYHYEAVDVVVGTNPNDYRVEVTGNVNLSIDSGVVVSFYRNASNKWARLKFANGAKINAIGYDAVGSDTAFIQFTSLYATSDLIQAPLCGGLDLQDYSGALLLHAGAHPDSNIQYCEFKYAQVGIRLLQSLNLNRPIQNNYFEQNLYGITIDSSGNNIVNNLFINNRNGVAIRIADSPPPRIISYIQSNTFYANDTAVLINPETGSRIIITQLENNIFASNLAGAIALNGNGCTIQSESRNNLYWNNELNVDGTYILLNNSNTENKDIVNEYCPMLVHKAKLSDNQRIEVTYPHDGFYLAQRDGDASRFPLSISSLNTDSGILDITGIGLYGPGNGELIILVGVSSTAGIPTNISYSDSATWKGKYVIQNYDSGLPPERYEPGSQPGSGPVWLVIGEFSAFDGWQITSGAHLDLLCSNSSRVTLHLPETTINPMEAVTYWIAEDGSVYHGRASHEIGWSGDLFNQDGYFAMQYDMPSITGREDTGLAMSAYDGRYARYGTQEQARSPAVDKGAVKVTPASIAGTTNDVKYTLFASLGWTNTDDGNLNTRDSQTTIRVIPAQIPLDHTDPINRLDLGYHYKNGVVYSTDVCGQVETIYNEQPVILNHAVYATVGICLAHKDLVSGEFNSNNLVDQTMVVYGVNGMAGLLYGVGYHVFNTPINNPIMTSYTEWISIAGYVGLYSVNLGESPVDHQIVAAVAHYSFKEDGYEYSTHIDVYRYNASSDQWNRLAYYTVAGTYYDEIEHRVLDVSVAVDQDNYVWVTWVESFYESSSGNTSLKLRAARMPISANDFDIGSSYYTLVDPLNIHPEIGLVPYLSTTYDPENLPDRRIRLVFHHDQDNDGITELRASPLVIDQGYITLFYDDPPGKPVSEPDHHADGHPRIVYNPHNTGSVPAYRVFSTVYEYEDGSSGYLRAYNLTDPDSETWSPDNAFGSGSQWIQSGHLDMTYRALGDKFVVWREGDSGINSNRGSITNSGHFPRVSTNAGNQRDIFITWKDSYNLDNNSELENGVFVRELFP